MIKKIIGLSGLPRSGSTLLSAILCQNPEIHSEGLSAVCQLMWDMKNSFELDSVRENILATNKTHIEIDLINSIPFIYYNDIKESIVFDKSRSWTLQPNIEMFKKYIDLDAKIVVLERPVIDIVKSFVNLRLKNNYQGNIEAGIVDEDNEYIRRPLDGIKWAKKNNNGEFLFIQYDDLVSNTKATLEEIYKFCDIEFFEHDFNNIVRKYPENDEVYDFKNLHNIRPTISKQIIDVKLSENTIKKCLELENF